jgi:hypothetical protein
MRNGVIGVGTLTTLFVGVIIKTAGRVLFAMFVLWLIGFFYPFVSLALGVPEATFYDFVSSIVHSVVNVLHGARDASQCVR